MPKHLADSTSGNMLGMLQVTDGRLFLPQVSNLDSITNPASGEIYFVKPSGRIVIWGGESRGWDLYSLTENYSVSRDVLLLGVGGVTENSAIYKARSNLQNTTAKMRYSVNPDLSGFTDSPGQVVSSESGNTVEELVTGLETDTKYYYDILIDDAPVFGAPYPEFVTAPSGGVDTPFVFGWAGDQSGSMADIFNTVSGHGMSFLGYLGDFGYNDAEGDITIYRTFYESLYGVNTQYVSGVVRQMSTNHGWDDHDYGANNSGITMTGKESGRQAFLEYCPHYPLEVTEVVSGINYKHTWGNAEFFYLDTRYLRIENTDTSRRLPSSDTNDADTGSSTTTVVIQSTDSPSSEDNFYNGWYIKSSGRVSLITAYDGGTRTATFQPAIPGFGISGAYFLSGKSMLNGAGDPSGQTQWLVDGINHSTKRWKFVMVSTPFASGFDTSNNDHFGGYDSPDFVERDYLNQQISGYNVIWLCTDKHFAAVDDSTNAGKFPVALCGSIYQSTPTPFGTWSNGTYEGNNYGLVEVNTSPRHEIVISIRDDTGAEATGPTPLTIPDQNTVDPTHVSGLIFWLKAESGTMYTDGSKTTTATSGDSVQVWEDNSGSGNDASQSSAGLQPTYVQNYFNGRDALVFDGTEDMFINAITGMFTGSDTPFNVFALIKQNSISTNQNVVGVGNSASNTQALTLRTRIDGGGGSDDVYGARKSDNAGSQSVVESTTPPDTSGLYLLNWRTNPDGNSISMWRNGSGLFDAATFNVGAATYNQATIGGLNRISNSPSFDGGILEVFGFDTPLSRLDRLRMESYIQRTYGVVMSGAV